MIFFLSIINLNWKDGNWTAWSDWNNCSLPCGGGIQTHTRTCNNPPPQYGGQNCSATNLDIGTQPCNTQHCPISMFFNNF